MPTDLTCPQLSGIGHLRLLDAADANGRGFQLARSSLRHASAIPQVPLPPAMALPAPGRPLVLPPSPAVLISLGTFTATPAAVPLPAIVPQADGEGSPAPKTRDLDEMDRLPTRHRSGKAVPGNGLDGWLAFLRRCEFPPPRASTTWPLLPCATGPSAFPVRETTLPRPLPGPTPRACGADYVAAPRSRADLPRHLRGGLHTTAPAGAVRCTFSAGSSRSQ